MPVPGGLGAGRFLFDLARCVQVTCLWQLISGSGSAYLGVLADRLQVSGMRIARSTHRGNIRAASLSAGSGLIRS